MPLTATTVATIPAFKEWSLVCDAMGEGRQAIILRKGGIAEGRAGFAFKHASFLLFPTRFHAQRARLRPEFGGLGSETAEPMPDEPAASEPDPEAVTFTLHARMTESAIIDRWDAAVALAPFHGWTEEIIRERFDYTGDQRLHLAMVRVSRLAEPWTIAYEKRYGGCRSWVEVPAPPPPSLDAMVPALAEADYAAVRVAICAALAAHGCRLESVEA